MSTFRDLSVEEVEKLLPEKETVHVFHSKSGFDGEVWPKRLVLDHVKKHGAELAAKTAQARGHGIVTYDEDGGLMWIENKGAKYEPTKP